jgi:hypothetical protein
MVFEEQSQLLLPANRVNIVYSHQGLTYLWIGLFPKLNGVS